MKSTKPRPVSTMESEPVSTTESTPVSTMESTPVSTMESTPVSVKIMKSTKPRPVSVKIMKSTKTRPVSDKETYLAEIEAAIEAAPDEPESITKERKFTIPRQKIEGRVVYGQTEADWDRFTLFERMSKRVERCLRQHEFDKVTFHFGPTTYEVWNTKEALRGFRDRFKRQFPK